MRRGTNLMRLRDERVKDMKAEHWSRVNVRGINPYAIDRVDGTYTVEFDRYGRSLPIGGWNGQHDVAVRAYDVRCPDGSSWRFARLKDARTFVTYHSNGLVIPAALAAGIPVRGGA